MGKCDKIEDTCGKKINARCVDYEGTVNTQSELTNDSCLNVHNTTQDIYNQLEDIQNSIDLEGLGENCVTYEQEGDKLTVVEALLGLESKLCELVEESTSGTGGCHPIFDADITCLNLDLGCLTTDPCGEQITTFKQLLQALIIQACA